MDPIRAAGAGASRRRRLTAGMAALGVAAGLGLAALPQAANASSSAKDVYAFGSTALHTSTHKKLLLSVSAYRPASKSAAGGVYVSLSLPNGHETHSWTFQTPRKALNVSSKGRGTLAVGKKLGKYGTISLHIRPASKVHKTACNSGGTLAKVTMSGTFAFNTHSGGRHSWGKVGPRVHFGKKASTVSWYQESSSGAGRIAPNGRQMATTQCGIPVPPCSFGTSWSVFKGGSYIFARTSGSRTTASAGRTVSLAHPKHASRSDYVTTTVKRPHLTVASDDTAKMRIFGSHGTGTITSSAPAYAYDGTCGRHHTKTSSQSWSGPFKATTKVSIKGQVFGVIKIGSVKYASFDKTAKS